MQINHHGRPTTLDLDCRETLRYPLLSFSHRPHRVTSVSTARSSSTEGVKDSCDFDLSLRALTPETAQGVASDLGGNSCVPGEELGKHDTLGSVSGTYTGSKLSERSQEEGEQEEHSLEQHWEGSRGSSRIATASRTSTCRDTCQDGNIILKTTPDHAGPRTHDANLCDLTNGMDHPGSSRLGQHQSRPSHHPLVPARLIAVLVDGAGRGWMAARRLWSVREVGMHALAEAGLAWADVDQEQEVSDKRVHDCCSRGDRGV